VPGHLIPQLYFDYLRGGASEPLAGVFRHNQMDLRGLAALAGRMFALITQTEIAEGDPLELYGLSKLLHRRGERARARQLYERALEAGLSGAVSRAARRELAALAKHEHDYPRAIQLWQELTGAVGAGLAPPLGDPRVAPTTEAGFVGRGFSRDIEQALPLRASAPETSVPSGAEAQGKNGRGMSELKLRPPKESIPFSNDTLEAFEQLAMYYEHHAKQPERAAELTRDALRELRGAFRLSLLDPSRYRKLKTRLEHRLRRLERKTDSIFLARQDE